MIELFLLAQSVGPGYIPVPRTPNQVVAHICVNDRGSYANLRTAPSTTARSLSKLYGGTPVEVHKVVSVNGFYWTAVRTINGKAGWVRDDYVCVTAD